MRIWLIFFSDKNDKTNKVSGALKRVHPTSRSVSVPRSLPAGPKFDLATPQSVPGSVLSELRAAADNNFSFVCQEGWHVFLRWGYHYTHSAPSLWTSGSGERERGVRVAIQSPPRQASSLSRTSPPLLLFSSPAWSSCHEAIQQRLLCKQVWCLFVSESFTAEGW